MPLLLFGYIPFAPEAAPLLAVPTYLYCRQSEARSKSKLMGPSSFAAWLLSLSSIFNRQPEARSKS